MQSPKSWKPAKLGVRVGLNPKAFRQLIFRRGSRVRWEKAARCPCTVMGGLAGDEPMASHEPRSGCAECLGRGVLYHDAQEIRAVVQGASKTPLFYQLYGEQAKGMVSITTLPEHMAKGWDRFTVLDSIHSVSELRERSGDKERLRYPIQRTTLELGADADETELTPTESYSIYIRRANAAGHATPEPLREGLDFTIDTKGQLVWLGEKAEFATGLFVMQLTPRAKVPAWTRFRVGALDFLSLGEAVADGAGRVNLTLRAEVAGAQGNLLAPLKARCIDRLPSSAEHGLIAESDTGTSGGKDSHVPAVGERFSIEYWANPTYIVNDTPHPHRDSWISSKSEGGVAWARYPIQVHCWLESFGPPQGYGVES